MMENDKRFVILAINKLTQFMDEEKKDYEKFASLKKWFDEKGFLTPKQIELLTIIFERN